MVSQTSANVNANVNPIYADIRIEECCNGEMLDGWERWSLEDVIHTIESMKKTRTYGCLVSSYLGLIIFNKLLKAAEDPNVPFDLIERTVHLALRTKVPAIDDNIFAMAGFHVRWEPVGDFFKEFIKYGKRDARYYDLIYEMLTYQTVESKSFPLGASLASCKGFKCKILSEFPPAMRKQLEGEGFYAKDGDVYYSLLTGASVGM